LIIYSDRIAENASKVAEMCAAKGVEVAAVTKGACAEPHIAGAMIEGLEGLKACVSFADSRVQNLARLKKEFPNVPRMLLRIPMKSELEDVVHYADCSLVSMVESVQALEDQCRKMNAEHQVILMVDLGDRREGILDQPEGEIEAFAEVLKKTPRLTLRGVGTNFGCFAGVLPSAPALHRLCLVREIMEKALAYKVPICSGGSTSSLALVERDELPKGVNQLRIGEAILLGKDITRQRTIPWLRQDTVHLEAEIIEKRIKPSLPQGERGADAFGQVRTFEEKENRQRIILALGRQDVSVEDISPLDPAVKILGGSSDHTIAVMARRKNLRWGDTLRFSLNYAAMLRLMTSPYVYKEYR
jgi:predicted amino acid racemase